MTEIRREKAYKALPPLQTVNRAREILAGCDLFTVEQDYRFPVAGVACCRVWLGDEDVAPLSVGVNGKGMNARYALASAYGEMMERLQNGALFPMRPRRFALPGSDGTPPMHGDARLLYQFAPDETWLTSGEVAEECGDVVEKMFSLASGEAAGFLSRALEAEKTPCAPFYSVSEGKTRLLPLELVWNACGTNGMCAGNDRREALLQGVCEILERYAIRLLYEEDSAPPEVPPETFAGTRVLENLRRLEGAGMRFSIRDCSMGRGLPVVGLWLIKPDGRAAFHLGADPSPVTALERCLTELFQGSPADNERRYHAGGIGKKPGPGASRAERAAYYGHFAQSVASGFGAWPDCAARTGAPFQGFDHPVTRSDADDLRYLSRLLEKCGLKLFARDNTTLGFPALQAFIPGASEIDFIFDQTHEDLFSWTRLARCHRTLLNLPRADGEALSALALALREARERCLTDVFQPDKWFLAAESLPVFAHDQHAFSAALFLRAGLFADSAREMEAYLAAPASQEAPRRLCMAMRDFAALRAQGADATRAQALLAQTYGEALAFKAAEWRFEKAEWPVCFDCEACGARAKCRFAALCRRQMKAQQAMAAHPVQQETLRALFESAL